MDIKGILSGFNPKEINDFIIVQKKKVGNSHDCYTKLNC